MSTLSIDLGCGPRPRNPFKATTAVGVDLQTFNCDSVLVARLGFEALPFEDSSADFITAFDLIEHIPRHSPGVPTGNPFIFLMSEIWRVLRNGGLFYAQTPAYPSPNAFSDPTHVNIITSETVRYFATEMTADGQVIVDDRVQLGKRYGFTGDFVCLRNHAVAAYGHQVWLLRARKNPTPQTG